MTYKKRPQGSQLQLNCSDRKGCSAVGAIHELPLQYATVAAGLVPALIMFYTLN
ncbi:hypothetical protein KKE26_11890 [bacterium]|nr:hypothetical protein [bacterium]